ncbi:DUF6531 domain-containing protein [Nocardioides sp. AX2bis]|uniref:DUF6531 domain-containing protein n=1 Tax=Nocardioides sp. AX2bis TaxID=2653157 RepID=UPI0012EF70D1|nr:DUF6531 domain-containing protein [Nocardioides sp. AX2bis]VXB81193.1 RHS repeat-associated core domain-containing protein [Nocardioides sp. AX2bis]
MVDTSGWAGLPDVEMDEGAANLLAAGCEDAARLLREQASTRRSLTTDALQDFEGRFSRIFEQNQGTADSDSEEIAVALRDVATQIRHLVSIVPDENARRRAAREWAERRAEDKSKLSAGDLLGDEDPPEGPTSPPAPQVMSASATTRENPPLGAGGDSAGTSSARPAELRGFVTGVEGRIQELDGRPGRLEGLNSAFTTGFDWGTGEPSGVDGASVYAALRTFSQLNRQDKLWVNTLAEAFEQAGGQAPGGMVSLSNAALAASLRAAGVSVSRLDIAPTSPRLYGITPTTGYADDPVNAATGNFVEPETDLAFSGGCGALVLTRMYNSFHRAAGAFGPGWSSWTETRLDLDDEAAHLTLPDGRVVVFPRLGEGWDRATGESMWLERDAAADELRATDNGGGTWRFSRAGTPLSQDRGEGTMVGFVHEDGRLVRLEHERGRHVVLTWDGDRVVAAAASDGRRVDYAYDEGRLVAATGALGTRTYRWDEAGLVEAVIDADGVVEVENVYDEQARVTAQRSPHGRTSRYSYLPGHVTQVADPDGTRSNTWIHDSRGRLIGLVDSDGHRQSTSYDQHGNAVLLTARDGSVTVREHDQRGRTVREVSPAGADLRFEHDDLDRLVRVLTADDAETRLSYVGSSRNPSLLIDPEGGHTRFEWERGLLVRVVDPTGVPVLLEHDVHGDLVATSNALGDTARIERDAAGRVTAAVTPSGHRTTYLHGPAGVTERRDPDGAVWLFEYTAGGRLATVVDPTGGRAVVEHGDDGDERRRVDALGRSVQQQRDDLGNLASVELPDGSRWHFTHDALSRLVSTTTPDGQTWTRRYDAVGNLAETVAPTGDRVTVSTDTARGTVVAQDGTAEVIHRFDALGRQLGVQQSDGSAAVATYDRCGRVVEQLDVEGGLTRIDRDAGGRAVSVTSPTGEVTRFEHDACGRRSAVVDPLGARTEIGYDADSRPVRVVLPTGEVGWTRFDECGRPVAGFRPGQGLVRHAYDAAGRIVETQDSASGLRRFTYDAVGQLASATNGNGGVTRYDHDVRGRMVAVTDPMGGVTRRAFDAMDRCVAETDSLGRTTRAGYDAAGRQAWQEDARGRRTEWSYDSAGRVSSVSLDGRPLARISRDVHGRSLTLTDTTRPDGRPVVHEAEWNRRGQLVRRSRDGQTMRWSHDASGRRESMTLPDGRQVTYSYDAAGRLAAVDHPLLGRATMERDATGRVTGATAGELRQSWTYADGFLASHRTADGRGATRTTVQRDDEGRILSLDRDGEVTSFDYDAAHQVVESRTGGDAVHWRYDPSGRITSESTPQGRRDFAYDAGSQLLAVEGPEGTTRHAYDELGRRTRTTWADGRTRDLTWSPTGWLATIVDESGGERVRTELHVDASAELASIDGTSVLWDTAVGYAPPLAQLGDVPVLALGAVTAVGQDWLSPGWRGSRADGEDVWSVLGGTAGAGPGLPGGVGISPAGQLTIGDLEWLGARVYDAAGRGFLAADPLDPVTGAGWSGNPYAYAGNDPLHALDPTGLKPVSEADLQAANMSWAEAAWDGTKQWAKDNTDYLIGAGIAALGVAALFIPVVGPAVGGALISAGADVIMQRAEAGRDGQINVGQVLVAGAAGLVGGGAGSVIKASSMGVARKVVTNIAVETGVGAASGFGTYAVDEDRKGWDWGDAGVKTLQGGGGGLIGGSQTAKFNPLSDAAGSAAARRLGAVAPEVGEDAVRLTTEQVLARHAAELGVNVVKNAETELLKQTLTTGELDPQKFRNSMLQSTGTGALGAVKPGAATIEAPTQ